MAMLSKDQILGAADLPTVEVDVPEWGGTVRLGTLRARDRDAFEASLIAKDGKRAGLENMRARFVALCIQDDDGNRMFSDAEIEALGGKSAKAVEKLFVEAQKLNALSDEDVKELEKNSGTGQDGDSSSTSPGS